jgi:hypothetical protein
MPAPACAIAEDFGGLAKTGPDELAQEIWVKNKNAITALTNLLEKV